MPSYSKRFTLGFGLLLIAGASLGCPPEVGSEAWCEKMKETPKGDWSANDAAEYARNCLLK